MEPPQRQRARKQITNIDRNPRGSNPRGIGVLLGGGCLQLFICLCRSRKGRVMFLVASFLCVQRFLHLKMVEISNQQSLGSESMESLLLQQAQSHSLVSQSILSRTRTIRSLAKKQQIENYRNGKGLLLNLHATHHGGTTFCDILGRTGGPVVSGRKQRQTNTLGSNAPSFACWFDQENVVPESEQTNYTTLTKANVVALTPWLHDETDSFVRALRPYYHMVSWEYRGVDDMARNLSKTNWEHPNLVSVAIVRDPVSRILAGDQNIRKFYPGYNTGTLSHAGWWELATDPKRRHTDNFFFRILEGTPRPTAETNPVDRSAFRATVTPPVVHSERQLKSAKKQAKQRQQQHQQHQQQHQLQQQHQHQHQQWRDDSLPVTPPPPFRHLLDQSHYDRAVAMLDRFTVVLDIACLHDGLRVLSTLLGLDPTRVRDELVRIDGDRSTRGKTRSKLPAKDRIGHRDVYEYLLQKNEWDIRLYEYAKTVSLVRCG